MTDRDDGRIEEKKLLQPKDNIVNISTHKSASFFLYISKIYLKRFENIELHALGSASQISLQVAGNLKRLGFAEVGKIYSETIDIQNDANKMVKAIRFTICLRRSQDFDKLVGDTLK